MSRRGAAIVGLEPSCLLSLRDEYQVLGLGDDAKRIGDRAFLFEEFLAREGRGGTLEACRCARCPRRARCCTDIAIRRRSTPSTPTRRVLALVPDLAVDVVESSCCGMAGSFGYDAAHYDVSLRMAELALLPAVRAAASGHADRRRRYELPAPDRGRTRGAAARMALHVARVLARSLGDPR